MSWYLQIWYETYAKDDDPHDLDDEIEVAVVDSIIGSSFHGTPACDNFGDIPFHLVVEVLWIDDGSDILCVVVGVILDVALWVADTVLVLLYCWIAFYYGFAADCKDSFAVVAVYCCILAVDHIGHRVAVVVACINAAGVGTAGLLVHRHKMRQAE